MTVRLIALAICLCSARVGNAAIIVTFDSTSITANQIGFVDVWIESSDGSDFLAGFDAYFRLSGPTANGNLSFAPVPSQPNSQTLPNYVFFGHPDIVPINYGATPLSSNEIRLTDFLLNFANQKELLSTRWLLARIAFVHTSATPALSNGDTYTIQMFAQSVDGQNDTAFFDKDIDLPINSFPETGSIRITSASTAVPEPSLGFISGIAAFALVIRRRIRAKS